MVMSTFKSHPLTLQLTLMTAIGVVLVSILLILATSSAFGCSRTHALGPRCSEKKPKEATSGAGSGTDDQLTTPFLAVPAFEGYPKIRLTRRTLVVVATWSRDQLLLQLLRRRIRCWCELEETDHFLSCLRGLNNYQRFFLFSLVSLFLPHLFIRLAISYFSSITLYYPFHCTW
jgi:hypothetical protein